MELNLEIKELREANKKLQEKLVASESEVESIVSAAVGEAVKQATEPLIEELDKAYKEIARLKAIINKDSTNSSKPSSTNGFKVIPNSSVSFDILEGDTSETHKI